MSGDKVITVNDVNFDEKAGSLFMVYQQQKERFAGQAPGATLGTLGFTGGLP